MHRSPQAYWRPSVTIALCRKKKRCTLDRLYQHICDGLDALFRAVGLRIAA
jgi:hypothetical protein